MSKDREIKDCIQEIYIILDEKPDTNKIVKKASVLFLVLGAIKFSFTKLVLIFS